MFDPALFDGDENAIVDFKYSSDPRLTWWFDHHQSAFLNAEDQEHFRRDTSGRKLYDPSYKSCTSFICRVGEGSLRLPRARSRRPRPLVADHRRRAVSRRQDRRGTGRAGHEADAGHRGRQGQRHRAEDHRLDAAPAARGDHRRARDPGALRAAVPAPRGIDRPDPAIAPTRRTASSSSTWPATTSRATTSSSRITCSRTSTYTVSVTPSSFRTKISVGSNPWTPVEPKHNLATHLRALRRRRTRPGRRDQPRARRTDARPRSGRRNRRRAEDVGVRAVLQL